VQLLTIASQIASAAVTLSRRSTGSSAKISPRLVSGMPTTAPTRPRTFLKWYLSFDVSTIWHAAASENEEWCHDKRGAGLDCRSRHCASSVNMLRGAVRSPIISQVVGCLCSSCCCSCLEFWARIGLCPAKDSSSVLQDTWISGSTFLRHHDLKIDGPWRSEP
jgi:hypothetical protein